MFGPDREVLQPSEMLRKNAVHPGGAAESPVS